MDVVVLETPEPKKTIDEINLEAKQKIISKVSNHLIIEQSKPIKEKLEFFSKLNEKKFDNAWEKPPRSRSEKIKFIESELKSITTDIDQLPKDTDDYISSLQELEEISERLKTLKIKSSKIHNSANKKQLKIPKQTISVDENFSKGLHFEVEISSFEHQIKLKDLEARVVELEKSVGHWDQSDKVSKKISDLIVKTYFLDENILEKNKEMARNLGVDLDSMLSNNSQVLASSEIIEIIEQLYQDTYDKVSQYKSIYNVINKLKIFQSVYISNIEADKSVIKLEHETSALSERISESLTSLKEVKEGITKNKVLLEQSILNLNTRIIRI
jgi:Dynamitin